jgi:polyhydroxyalkanoate synthesis regulator phasin
MTEKPKTSGMDRWAEYAERAIQIQADLVNHSRDYEKARHIVDDLMKLDELIKEQNDDNGHKGP